MLHRAELRQEAPALLVVAEAVDHPGGHVVDRDVGRRAGARRRQLLHDQRRIEPRQARAADIVAHIDAAEAQRRRLAQHLLGEDLLGIPPRGLRQHAFGRELPCRIAEGLLVLGEREIHARADHIGGSPSVKRSAYSCAMREQPRLNGALLWMVVAAALLALVGLGGPRPRLRPAARARRALHGAVLFVTMWSVLFLGLTLDALPGDALIVTFGLAPVDRLRPLGRDRRRTLAADRRPARRGGPCRRLLRLHAHRLAAQRLLSPARLLSAVAGTSPRLCISCRQSVDPAKAVRIMPA